MLQNRKILLGILILVIVAGGIWAFNRVLGEPEAASAPISSVPLELEATAVPSTETPEPEAAPGLNEVEAAEPTSAPTATPQPTASPAPGPVIFEISQAESEVRFTLDELLRGEPNTVIGVSNQVAGQIAVDFADLRTVQVGVILVNARTLATDNNFRNRAIGNVILETNAYEFVTFTPTAISGLPDTLALRADAESVVEVVVPGDSLTFQITGDLTIRDITNEVVFEVTVTAVSEARLEGTAVTTVQRSDYNLVIPEVEGVADVSESVLLEIDFVATAVE